MTTLIAVTMSLWGSLVSGQSWQPPADSARCPSKWGSGDQRGSGNHMNAQTVLRAARLIRTGEVFELGRVLSDSMPLSAGRRFEVVTKRSRQDPGSNYRGSNEELVVAEIGQVGTQFDTSGPVHQIMLVVNGIHLLENLRLDGLAASQVYEFALIVEPLKIQGGTGSTVAPIAIH